MRILLVDDEIIALNALKKRVDWLKYGFTEVLTAQDAALARALFEKHEIDMMLCDIEMPGESGLALVSAVRAQYPSTECIMVTCHAEFDYIKTAMKHGVSDYILKPIDYAELEGQLALFVKRREDAHKKSQIAKYTEKRENVDKDSPKPAENRTETIKQYIEDHIYERIYVEDIAKLVHLNTQHLMRVFKRETGQSIMEYITQQRILIAGKLLRETTHDIGYIADCVGCDNSSYFTKLFKRYTGFTPSEYRKIAEGEPEQP